MRRTLLPLALAAVLAGCGEDGENLLTDRQAETLLTAVDDVERALGADDCDAAREAASEGEELATELPRRVDRELKANLVDWFDHVESRVRRDCEEPEPEPSPTPEPTPEQTPTPEPTPEETPTPEPTPEETPPPEPPPGNSGGSEAPEAGD